MDTMHLQSLEEKLQHLLQRFHLLQNENQKLKSSLLQTELSLAGAKKEIDSLQRKNDVLKLNASGLLNLEEKLAFQKRIDVYLKEIDKCLSLLNA